MKKGIVRIIVGIVLIAINILAIAMDLKYGNKIGLYFDNIQVFFYSLFYLIGYFLNGILGTILLVFGVRAYIKSNKGSVLKNKKSTLWLVKVAMLAAVSTVLMLVEFPLPFIAPPFYELDFSEVPVLIGAFAMGPWAGVAIEGLKIALNFLLNGTVTAGVGELANFVVGCTFVLPAAFIYKNKKTKGSAILGLIVGGAAMVILGCFVNAYIMLPTYGKAFGMPIEAIISMATKIWPSIDTMFEFILICVVPFNTIKAIVVSVITMLVYKPMHRLIEKIEK